MELLVDNTFASPALCRPLEHGATAVIHSLSKYVSGHGDVLGGAVLGAATTLAAVKQYLLLFGGCMDPFAAWLALRGVRTLALRMERSERTAARLAGYLTTHPAVRRVHYPGLPAHADHAIATRVLDGAGAMVTFELADGGAANRVYDRFQYFTRAASLGEVASLVTNPAQFSHRGLPAAERERLGIRDGLLRLSVGIEDPDDLQGDLEQALAPER